jgi:hypothetical protein
VDLMMAASSIQATKEHVMDFSHPFYYDTTTILFKRPEENKLFILAKPLRPEVVIGIIIVLPVSAFLLYIIEKLSPHYKLHGPDGRQNFRMSLWYMFGALFTKGLCQSENVLNTIQQNMQSKALKIRIMDSNM